MLGALLNVLLLSLSLQVMADNVLTFLLMWEVMSLSAYWLVLTEAISLARCAPAGGTRHDARGLCRAGGDVPPALRRRFDRFVC